MNAKRVRCDHKDGSSVYHVARSLRELEVTLARCRERVIPFVPPYVLCPISGEATDSRSEEDRSTVAALAVLAVLFVAGLVLLISGHVVVKFFAAHPFIADNALGLLISVAGLTAHRYLRAHPRWR